MGERRDFEGSDGGPLPQRYPCVRCRRQTPQHAITHAFAADDGSVWCVCDGCKPDAASEPSE